MGSRHCSEENSITVRRHKAVGFVAVAKLLVPVKITGLHQSVLLTIFRYDLLFGNASIYSGAHLIKLCQVLIFHQKKVHSLFFKIIFRYYRF